MSRPGMLVPERDLKGCKTPEQLVRALFRPVKKPQKKEPPPKRGSK